MKKVFWAFFVVLVMVSMTGCFHKHTFTEATCTEPKTCTECGETEGDPLPHNYSAATCTKPKTCKDCGAEEGEASGHTVSFGNCSSCGVFVNLDVLYDIVEVEEYANTYWETASQYISAANDTTSLNGKYSYYRSAVEYIDKYQELLGDAIKICEEYPELDTLKQKISVVKNYNLYSPRSSSKSDLIAFINDVIELTTLRSNYTKEMMNWVNKL